ncbi:MAG: acylase [Robiginitomaculum sp.]|nr:acylase [Robiginitomaculum sp.]
MKKIIRIVFGAVLVGLIGAGVWAWSPLPENPDAASLGAGAEKYDVNIIRDDWGVPHIYGKTDVDVAFGLGYAHSEDDFETMQLAVAAARGTLARYQGKGAAVTDYLVALMGVWDTVERRYGVVSPVVQRSAEAYAAGLNLYAAQNPDATWRGLAPFTGKDIIAGFVFKTPLFYGLDGTLLELFGDARLQEIALDPAGGRQSFHAAPKTMAERGSNGIAVSAARSGDNTTRLMINSHQPMSGPVAWYEAHLVSEQGIDMTGGLFVGTPFILSGFNDNLGWANTVSAQDLVDVYVLTINPKNKNQYRLDGKWLDFEQSTALIKVKLFGPFAFKAKRKVLRTQHGPVIEAKHGTYAFRYAGMDEIHQLEQYYRLNHAQDLDGFLAAMSLNALPSINYVYADKDGNVALIHNAQYPNRKAGWDWSKYLPGDRSDLIWQGYRSFSEVPKLINPSSGLVYNSNNAPYSATDGPDNLSPADFPKSMGLQTNQTNRSLRMMEMTDGVTSVDKRALLALKFDNKYAKNSRAAEIIAKVLAVDWGGDPALQSAAAHLRAWDMHTNIDNRHAALGVLTTIMDITEEFTHIPAPKPEDAFREAVKYLVQHHGRIDPTWGAVNRLVRGDIDVPIDGAPDVLRAIYPAELGDDGKLVAAAGDTWIALVEWPKEGDVAGKMTADVIHQFGSATSLPNSPHYANQAEMFAVHKWRKALRDKAEIQKSATRKYTPTDND